jgi:DNA-binding NarL/FixJ family response regulator
VRVILADDSALFRGGVRALLEAAGLEVLADVDTAAQALDRVGVDRPDVVIMDIRMAPTFTDEGLQGALAIIERYPNVGVLLLSTYAETQIAVRLLETSSAYRGYLLKDRVSDVGALVDAIARVARGESAVDPQIVSDLLAGRVRARELDHLAPREREVLALIAEGRSNAGIGRALFMSPKTVEAYCASVFAKLGLYVDADANKRVLAALRWLRSAE